MGEVTNTTAEKAPKKSWFKGLKSEFAKIIWPDREALTRRTVAVIITTVVLGIIIYVLDYVVELGIGIILG